MEQDGAPADDANDDAANGRAVVAFFFFFFLFPFGRMIYRNR